jgi:regulator of protease activity HflC (stomatin/prohibitin superfamily)
MAWCEQLTVSMETFGLAIIQTLLTDIEPAAKVKAAMNEINAATRLRAAAMQKAEADKIQVVKAAEADAEAKFLAGQGIARQRQVDSHLLRSNFAVLESVACTRIDA